MTISEFLEQECEVDFKVKEQIRGKEEPSWAAADSEEHCHHKPGRYSERQFKLPSTPLIPLW